MGLLIFLACWEILARILAKPILVPSLLEIMSAVVKIFGTGESYLFILFTLGRILFTLVLDLSLAFVFGFLAGLNSNVENALFPFENILRASPTVAFILLALIWFRSNLAPVFVASLIVFPILYRSIVDAIKNISSDFTELADDFNLSFRKRLFFLYLPHVSSALKTSLVTGVGLAVKVVITSEVLCQPKNGIGLAFQLAKTQLYSAGIFAWALISVMLNFLLQALFKRFGKKGRIKNVK
ncbi:MAG: ABC transporter permease subunit [Treponemataceae bacterium]